MGKSHSEGHHNNNGKPKEPKSKYSDGHYKNWAHHGQGAKQGRVYGIARAKTRPYLNGDALNTDYRRPPCLDEHASYHYWLCNKTACRAGECDAWCESERRTRPPTQEAGGARPREGPAHPPPETPVGDGRGEAEGGF